MPGGRDMLEIEAKSAREHRCRVTNETRLTQAGEEEGSREEGKAGLQEEARYRAAVGSQAEEEGRACRLAREELPSVREEGYWRQVAQREQECRGPSGRDVLRAGRELRQV